MRPATAKWPQPPEKRTIDPRGAPAQSSPSPAGFGKMSKEAQLSVAERDFILEALRENVRLDGRGPDQFRPLNLSFGDEYGHVKLQVGKTRLVTISIAIMQVTCTNFMSQHCCPHLR
jgi:hypothetical protein